MPVRLPLFSVLLILAALLMTSGAHGAPLPAVPNLLAFEEAEGLDAEADEEGEEAATECDIAYEEADEGVLSEEAAEQACAEEDAEAHPAAKPRGKAPHRAHKRKKTCRHKAPNRKRRCRRDRQGGGSNSRARGGATGQAGRRTPTSK